MSEQEEEANEKKKKIKKGKEKENNKKIINIIMESEDENCLKELLDKFSFIVNMKKKRLMKNFKLLLKTCIKTSLTSVKNKDLMQCVVTLSSKNESGES